MLSLSATLFRLGVGGANQFTIYQAYAGCKLVQVLAYLAVALAAKGTALTQVQAVQLASSLAVVWRLGRNMLEHRSNAARASSRQQISLDEIDVLFNLAFCQSLAVRSMLTFMHHHAPPGTAAGVARGFMKPGTVLPWLKAVAEATELLPESALEPGELPAALAPKCKAVLIVRGGAPFFSASATATMLGGALNAKRNAAGLSVS
jgi:hypothetical protein